jgi:hypothetical protein
MTLIPPPPPDGLAPTPLERFLLDPWDMLADLARQAASNATGWGLRLLAVATSFALLVLAARLGRRWWRQRRLAAGARLVRVLAPPQVEPGAADALWGNLAGLLRQRRPLDPRPHLAFELAWTTQGVTVGLWVPGTIAPRLVERAVEAGWPGARASTRDAAPPLAADAGMAVLGGELRLAGGPWQPLRTEHWVDPLRAVLGAAGELADHETAVVQVLARPAAGRRLVGAGRAARALAGMPTPRATLLGGILDLLTPGRRTPRRPQGTADPLRTMEARAALAKLGGPCWEVRVRYGVAGPAQLRGRLRARAHALAAAFAVHSGRNRLSRRRLWRPARTLAARPLHHGDLLSAGELASLAHLTHRPGGARAGSGRRPTGAAPARPSRTRQAAGRQRAGPTPPRPAHPG